MVVPFYLVVLSFYAAYKAGMPTFLAFVAEPLVLIYLLQLISNMNQQNIHTIAL